MYPLLCSLEARGLVAGEWELPGARGRRYYRITPAGDEERAHLAGRLAPHLDAVAASVEVIRAELLERRCAGRAPRTPSRPRSPKRSPGGMTPSAGRPGSTASAA
ncbi:MAG: PadR family transcriptional regulator [Actinomycetota bacterium]|nr:PadR family transcriptional regulator [Actinomycetota bacterium]